MTDLNEVMKKMASDGYYIMPDGQKAIYDLEIYCKEQDNIINEILPDCSNEFNFAVFRATLFYLGLGKDIDADHENFCRFVRNRKLNDLRSNTFMYPEKICLRGEKENFLKKFELDLNNPQKPFIVSSFHFSSYKTLFSYLIYNGFTVYMVASEKVIERDRENCELYVSVVNQVLGKDSKVKFVCAEDYNSLIMLAEEIREHKSVIKTVLLVFPDGNLGSKRVIDIKKSKCIHLFNKNILVRKGIFTFAEIFDIPVYNVIVDSETGGEAYINIMDYIESPRLCRKKGNDILQLLYNNLEKTVDESNFYKWECLMYMHAWNDHPIPDKVNAAIVTAENYEENRYTFFTMNEENFIFDSKYCLSYQVGENAVSPLKDIVLSSKVLL